MLWQTLVVLLFGLFPSRIIKFGDAHNDQMHVTNRTYQAPLEGCDLPPEEISLQTFFVRLAPDHSLEQYSAAINMDSQAHVTFILDFFTEQIVYVGRQIDDELLAAIRSDRGVEVVWCSSVLHLNADFD